MYMYHGFNPQKDGLKLDYEVKRLLQRETGWEAVMRVRCSKGKNKKTNKRLKNKIDKIKCIR